MNSLIFNKLKTEFLYWSKENMIVFTGYKVQHEFAPS